MTEDSDIDRAVPDALRRYRPAGPPPSLRARVLAAGGAPSLDVPRARRVGTTAAAWGSIAALLALACVSQVATARIDRRLSATVDGGAAERQVLVDSLTVLLGGDDLARLQAAQIVSSSTQALLDDVADLANDGVQEGPR